MTRQQIATRENGAVQRRPQAQPSGGLVPELTPKAVKDFLCPKASNEEIAVFVALCRSRRLNPFEGDAFIVKLEGHPAYYVISFRKLIEPCVLHPTFSRYEYGLILMLNGKPEERVGEFYLPNEKIVGAWVRIWQKTQPEPFTHRIAFEPWVKTFPKSNDPMGMWKTNPAHMICKTAVTQGFRYLYPGLTLANLPEDGEITKVMVSDAGVQSEAQLLASQDTELTPALAAGGQVDDAEEGEIVDASFAPEDWSGIQSAVDELEDDPKDEEEAMPTVEQARQAALVKRQRHFHLFMREKGYKTEGEVKKRLSDVLGEPVTSLKAFIADDDKFLKWSQADHYYFEDAEGDLFGK